MAKIVSVHSYRGGTGKSNISANLGVLLARTGARVGIVDTDIQSPGIHVIFGLEDRQINRALNDYLWGRCTIEETCYDMNLPEVTQAGGQLFLIPSSVKTGEITRVLKEGYDVSLLNDGFQDLLDHLKLDFLLIDTHPGLNEETLLSITLSDILLLILRPDKQDFQGTTVAVNVAKKLNVPRLLLVINKVLPTLDFKVLREQVEGMYNATVAGILPLTTQLFALASEGIFCLDYPQDPWTRELQNIAKIVSG